MDSGQFQTLKSWRQANGWTQAMLIAAAGGAISQSKLSNYENGLIPPDTHEALIAAGWTDATLRQNGLML